MFSLLQPQVRLIEETLIAYRSPWWLRTKYGAEKLIADFCEAGLVTVSFDITLANGHNLASPRGANLRSEIYDFLCLQAHSITHRRRRRGAEADRKHLMAALHVVDYFLLNDREIGLSTHGFAAVGTQHALQFLIDLSSSPSTVEGIYCWNRKLAEFLRTRAAELLPTEIAEVLKTEPLLGCIDIPQSEWQLGLTFEELMAARVFLYKAGLYRVLDNRQCSYRYGPNGIQLAPLMYRDTLVGTSVHMATGSSQNELCWAPVDHYTRECDAVVVWAGREDIRCSVSQFTAYKAKLMTWQHLSRLGIGIREDVLERIAIVPFQQIVSLKEGKGVTPVPPSVIALLLRNAISFFYAHGDHLLTSLTNILREAAARSMRPFQLDSELIVEDLLDPRTVAFGITCWSLQRSLTEEAGTRACSARYLAELRSSHIGLLDFVRVLYGASLIIVGTMQAARQGEMLDLTAKSLDPTEKWLALLTRKSGFDRLRNEDFRPAPKVAVDVLKRLAAFVDKVGQGKSPIFSMPTYYGLMRCDSNLANAAIDLFVDYFEGPMDAEGRRYYLRQHQLRQFFTATFFHCCSFAGMDVLRWFLRQLDAKHLWAYICASTPGAVLRRYKSVAAGTLIRGGREETTKLVGLLRRRFRISDFDIMTDQELAELLDDLQVDGSVVIEPIFASGGDMTCLRLGIIVWRD